MQNRNLLLGSTVAVGLGVLALWTLRSTSPTAPAPNSARVEAPRAEEPPSPASESAMKPTREPAEEPAPRAVAPDAIERETASGELFSPALRAYTSAELQRGWSEVRGDPIPPETRARLLAAFEDVLRSTPASWGRQAAEARNDELAQEAALDANDGIAWLEKLDESEPEASELPRSPERFEPLFRSQSAGSALDGPGLRPEDPLQDGALLTFPAGVFAVTDLARGRTPFPADVTLRGAGMDATLLVMETLRPREALRRFTVEDCTVFADQGIVDVRSKPSLLALRRVRLIGFDCGAGGSYAMNLDSAAITASGCRFEGGYGRNPDGHANLVRGSTPLLARFEACSLERVALGEANRPTVAFVDCALTDLLEDPPSGPLYQNCRISVLPREQRSDEKVRRRDMEELFPSWRERLQRR